jgi:hypothetical protein
MCTVPLLAREVNNARAPQRNVRKYHPLLKVINKSLPLKYIFRELVCYRERAWTHHPVETFKISKSMWCIVTQNSVVKILIGTAVRK